ncbi:MAG: SGNH/GDSL hydrolase family protein [Oscillospiraceae bacterium]|nr:SGNH/GDSL hydrolase family protein [Candidatus Equicaccousia limihippi]
MKKLIALLLCVSLVLSLCACNQTTTKKKKKKTTTGGETEYIQGEPTEEYEDVYIKGEDIHTTEVVDKRVTVHPNESPSKEITGNKLRALNIESGEDKAFIEAGILKDSKGNVSGNMTRVANALRKLKNGQNIKMITYGGLNTGGEDSYGKMFKEHLSSMGAGSVELTEYGYDRPVTYSGLAAYMIKSEIIEVQPDLVVLDLALGDGLNNTKANSAPFENIVRRILTQTKAGIIIVCGGAATQASWDLNPTNADPLMSGGRTLGYYQKQVAEFYEVPVIDFETVVWQTLADLVEKKYYSEAPLLSWETFGNSPTEYSFSAKINIANMLSLYCDKVWAKLNDASTKKEPTYGDNNLTSTYKFADNSYMNTDFVNMIDALGGKKVKGISCPTTFEQVNTMEGNVLFTALNNRVQTYTAEKYINVKYRNKSFSQASLTYTIPVAKAGTKYYFMAAYNGTAYQLYTSSWNMACYDSNGNHIKNVSQGRGGGKSMFIQQLPEGTASVKFTADLTSSQGTMSWFGFVSNNSFN